MARSGRAGRFWTASALTITGALLLLVAELTPLERIVTIARHPVLVRTVQAGTHDGWALVPIAVLAAVFVAFARGGRRPRVAFVGVGALGAVALIVALAVDRSAIHAIGAVDLARVLRPAEVRAGVGLYLETLGGALLVLGGATGALLV